MTAPVTRYARSGDVHIAYQVVGDGPFDLVFVPGFVSNVERAWDHPAAARFYERLASFCRLILFDKRGTGMSDAVPVDELPDLEQRMDDVRAVMDAAGSERASLFGVSEGGPMALLFAATYPHRADAVVVLGSSGRWRHDEDAPWGWDEQLVERSIVRMEERWGTGAALAPFAPSSATDEAGLALLGQMERASASPGAVGALARMAMAIDVRGILDAVAVPTLVMHRVGDPILRVDHGRHLGSHVPGARYVELPGVDHAFFGGDIDEVLDEVEEFLTGSRPAGDVDRVLATVLFTDIVSSTERAAELGDRRWRELLDAHDAMVRRQLDRFRGREVKTTGDGFLATFDGPARAIRCARAVADGARQHGLEVRAGLHTGEIEMRGEDVAGIGVVIASRVMGLAGGGEVLVSGTVKDLVAGSGLDFVDRGARELKGVPGEWRLFAAGV